MLTIRLRRIGRKNQPSFRVVVADKRVSASAGKFCEEVGFVNRVTKEIKLDREKISYWMKKGAQPSPTVRNILIAEKAIEGKKIPVHAKSKKKEGAAAPATPAKEASPAAAAAV
jgi:small subunit ribosomal protein S16